MQANLAMNTGYDGDLGTSVRDGYGGELESTAVSPRVLNSDETIELQPLIANSRNVHENSYV